ncbi:MAG: pilus assembly protein, partial [Selenomonadaceae bacterium]|nr:pilus assembly protein [Selenomonadaceae bacterium]
MEPKRVTQRGQAMLLYALLIPLLFLFLGVALDLGWYYLNVSRLQNAADAAVVAGARAFADDINEKNSAAKILVTYNYDGTITDKYATDNPPD